MKTWISGFLSGVCLMFWVIVLVGCATPKTNEEWAQRCLGQSNPAQFDKCVKAWSDWQNGR